MIFWQTYDVSPHRSWSVPLQISTSVLMAAQDVALTPRVLTSLVASRVAAIAAMMETVKHAQVFRHSLYTVFMDAKNLWKYVFVVFVYIRSKQNIL